jgi:hypothetical protein
MTTKTVWEEDCSVLALYGIDRSAEAAEQFYNAALSWFRHHGYSPDRLTVVGPAFNDQSGEFAETNRQLQRQGFEGVTGIFLVTLWPGGQFPIRDWLMKVSWSGKNHYTIIAAENAIVPFRSDGFRRFAEEVVRLLKPGYGTGYHMLRLVAPDMHALGIQQQLGEILTGEAYEESRNVARWGNMGMEQSVWQVGVIRDVYPWNFLTAPQLDAAVEGSSLQEWISQDPQRGCLTDVSDSVVLWDVPEESIPHIRARLKEAHLLFDWRRFVGKPS